MYMCVCMDGCISVWMDVCMDGCVCVDHKNGEETCCCHKVCVCVCV